GAAIGALVICLPIFFLTYWLGAGTLAFSVDAKRSCLPGVPRLRRHAKLVASVLLLPAIALSVAALITSPERQDWGPTVLALAISPPLGLLALSGRRHVIRQGPRSPLRVLWGTASRPGSRESQRPVQIIRACLGGMFVEPSPRQVIIGVVLLALFIVAAGLPWLGAHGARWALIPLALVAAGLVSTAFLAQISKLTCAQWAELALLPGLGATAIQYRALCRAVLVPPLLWLGVVLLLGCAGLLLTREPILNVTVLALCIFIIWLTYAIFALQKMATFPPKQQSLIAEFLLLYIGIYAVYPIYNAHALMRIIHLFWWASIIPALLSVGIAGAIGSSVHRLAIAPHPFLTSGSTAGHDA
ncbi:MAG: hypothetical protein ACRETR_02930, partial [Steroidobacteraceae bacterium]